MITIGSLWLAIVLSAVFVWIGSAIVWMALPHHKKEFGKLPNEDAVRQAMSGASPGLYSMPHGDASSMKDPTFIQKMKEGPNAFVTVVPNGAPAMGGNLVKSFVFYLFVSFMVAYLASNFLPAGMEYLQVFRFAATTAWLAYGLAAVPDAVWFGKPWSSVVKGVLDAFLYGLLTGGVFGWLWPS